jgi:hypothetical protein
LPSQTRELATGTAKGDEPLAAPEGPSRFLSKTWNVAKLTSKIASSPSAISCATAVLLESMSAAGAPLAPYAPLASDNDNPAAPKTGTALLARFGCEDCFARAM